MKTKITLPLFFYNITTVITICGNGPFCITIFTDFPAAQEEQIFYFTKNKKKKGSSCDLDVALGHNVISIIF